jgi:hypothetical protein
MSDETKQETPEHIKPLEEIIDSWESDARDIDLEDYAKIAFDISKASEGSKEAVARISKYVQDQHRALKSANETIDKIKSKVASWIVWASHWTVAKSDT